ncbi:LysR family transcriptional regulator [Acidocella sp.]|uniref:LysR family transcriptional regulator n=1 Tax=Acidocella sp. TaxID=50710 RepID=UPI0026327E33|nr:LysR family transcriptional regulator [Acidocella sp.]
MELHQLRCFIAVAEELHFGNAAQRLGMLPSALGRNIRLLEEDLGTRLLARTTRSVTLTADGAVLLDDARALLAEAERIRKYFRGRQRPQSTLLRLGAIDSASAGLVPLLLQDFRAAHPEISVQLVEDKTVRLLPRLLSGSLDLALVRPPELADKALDFMFLFHETAVVAVPEGHELATRPAISVEDLANQPLIVPDRRSRPHSHDLTMKLFAEAGLQAHVAQLAEEKQTIVNLVAAQIGVAIVPRWTARMAVTGVRYVPLKVASGTLRRLPLAAVWLRDSRDQARDKLLALLRQQLSLYAAQA